MQDKTVKYFTPLNIEDPNFDRKLDIITAGAKPFVKEHLIHKVSNSENRKTIVAYIIAMQTEVSPSQTYRIDTINKLTHFTVFHNPKRFKDMTRQDIIDFLDSLRKPETIDTLHKWVGTYETNLRHSLHVRLVCPERCWGPLPPLSARLLLSIITIHHNYQKLGRTVPSFRIVIAEEKQEWKDFRNALDKSERKEFDEMWDIPRLYVTACSNSVQLVPLHPIVISIMFHHYKELKECISEVERIDARVNNSKKKRGEGGEDVLL